MKLKVWGARGSVPAPGPQMNRYGGNTSCVQLTLASGDELILDAGTGIRALGLGLTGARRIHILLTHLHLDHIQGLMFFPPCFRAESEITIWGPSSPEASLEDRIARYISAPLSPVEVRELPCSVAFRDTPASEWELGGATIRAEAVTHRGPTLGYRIDDGVNTVAYVPDHEPALGAPLAGLEPEWISGFDLARDADLLIHDCQYTDDEYPEHVGWGHSGAHRRTHLRPPGRRPPADAVPPRPAALRRVPRPGRDHRARRLERAGRRPDRARDGHGGLRAGARRRRRAGPRPRLIAGGIDGSVQAAAPNFRQRDKQSRASGS